MQLLDRELSVIITQNYGVQGPQIYSAGGAIDAATSAVVDYSGYTIDISPYIVELGETGWECDTTNLTVASMQTCEVKCLDNASMDVWNFIQGNLDSPVGILSPYITISLGGVVQYYGMVDLTNCSRTTDEKEFIITIP